MTRAEPTKIVDNDHIRVTRWRFPAAGCATGEHRHEFGYIVVPVTGGTFAVTDADGSRHVMVQVAGDPYVRPAGVVHDVASTTAGEAVFVEIELNR